MGTLLLAVVHTLVILKDELHDIGQNGISAGFVPNLQMIVIWDQSKKIK